MKNGVSFFTPITPTGALTKTKNKPTQKFLLRQPGHAETCSVPVAFRPLLAKGLALSRVLLYEFYRILSINATFVKQNCDSDTDILKNVNKALISIGYRKIKNILEFL